LAFDDLIDAVANKATSSVQNMSHERNQKFISSLSVTLLLCFFFILRSSASPFLNPLVSVFYFFSSFAIQKHGAIVNRIIPSEFSRLEKSQAHLFISMLHVFYIYG
jgi:hypothetical protein